MTDMQANYDPVTGATSLALFGGAPAGAQAFLSGAHLREGLLASLVSAEVLAATAGVVPWFDLGGGQKGIAVIGGARAKLAQAPAAVKTIYLAAHGAARQAQAHSREASPTVPISARTDAGLSVGQIGIAPVVVLVVTVLGVAAIVSGAWFAKSTVERIVQTKGDDLRASYAVDTAAKLATAQIAAGQTVDPGVYKVLEAAASKESAAPLVIPAIALAGVAGVGVAIAWRPVRDALGWGAMVPRRRA